jgi:hypothetical protein
MELSMMMKTNMTNFFNPWLDTAITNFPFEDFGAED